MPKGTYVLVAIQACNRDKRLWGEDAEEWKPERWLAPLPDGLVKARVPGVYSNLCVCRRIKGAGDAMLTVRLGTG